jgi:hypothetical protein
MEYKYCDTEKDGNNNIDLLVLVRGDIEEEEENLIADLKTVGETWKTLMILQ